MSRSTCLPLCAKAGSATVLKGGHEAADTNSAAVDIIRRELEAMGDPDIVTLLPNDRQATAEMLGAVGMIDVVIPRGSRRLIDFVRDTAAVPVIETGAGVCHTYVHSSAMLEKARDIVFNAKTRRKSAYATPLTRLKSTRRVWPTFRPYALRLQRRMSRYMPTTVRLRPLPGHTSWGSCAKPPQEDMGCEWMDYKMTVVTADGLRDAIDFIDAHTSRHSECIVAEDEAAVAAFLREVDAACVYANVSTAFTDGGQFGFGPK